MVFGIVAAVVAVALAGCVVFLLKELENCRKKETEHTGMSLDQARECVQREVEAQRELMELMYFTCDNFQKHQQSIAEKIAGMYGNGTLQGVCANIVNQANLAENGALYKLAKEYSLTDNELRVCCYIHLGFKWQEICTADTITENAYSVRCSRIRKKLGLSKDERIPVFISEYCNKINSSVQ